MNTSKSQDKTDPWGIPSAGSATHGFDPARLNSVKRWMSGWVERGQLPGVTVVIARHGEVVFAEQVGYQDGFKGSEEQTDLRPDTIYRMYSMTKPVTGVALLTLLEDGLCLLDDPVAEYLPEFADMGVLSGGGLGGIETVPARPMTLRHLATHTAGLSYHFFPHEPVSALYREAEVIGIPGQISDSLEQWCQKLAKLPLRSQPGERWHYSVGMDVLGRVAEVLTGKRFGDYLSERIFEPLGMKDSGFFVRADQSDRFASSYIRDGSTGSLKRIESANESPYLSPPSLDFGGGGLVSTAGDYLRFAQMLLDRGTLEGERILSPASVEMMTSDHLPFCNQGGPAADGPSALGSMRWFTGAGFGLTGLVVTDPVKSGIPGSVGEFSWGGAASTNFWIDPKRDLTAMILTQLLPSGTYPLRPQIRWQVYQALSE